MSGLLQTAAGMANRHIERRLAEFVDRSLEMDRFRTLLDTGEKPIMVVHGGTGMGKTSLLLRMIHQCGMRQLRKSEVTWNDTLPHDYMAVMRKIRDDVGVEHFKLFTDLINYYTDEAYKPKLELTVVVQGGGSLEVASGLEARDSTIGDVAAVMIKDNMLVVPRGDLGVSEPVRREQLTARFVEGLRSAAEASAGSPARSSPIVILLDATEKMSPDTRAWLWEQLLNAVRTGLLPNVRFVILGQRPPPEDRDWDDYVDRAELRPLTVADISAYLKNRISGIPEETRAELAKMIHVATKGLPTDVAALVDAYMKQSEGTI
jgi:hypothetical protein